MSTSLTRPDVAAGELVRPVWRRLRYWVALVVVLVLAAMLVGALSNTPGRALDPRSAAQNGSKALARLLAGYGTDVTRTTAVADARATGTAAGIVITSPNDYSDAQLRSLAAASARIVLVEPGVRALRAIAPGVEPDSAAIADRSPGCADTGARGAGAVDLPAGITTYDATAYVAGTGVSCYGGAVVVTPTVVVLGSADLLRNDELDHEGVAALDVNLLSSDRSVRRVVFLLPGTDAGGSGPASIWDLFPDGAYRAFWWLIAVGVLVALWRGRRLGGVVDEPLPVIVRSAEVVEGHGRLYLRAHAVDRAAAALRAAVTARLAARLGLPRGTGAPRVASAVAPVVGRSPADTHALLAGSTPADDAGLLRLATELDRLEADLGGNAAHTARKGDR